MDDTSDAYQLITDFILPVNELFACRKGYFRVSGDEHRQFVIPVEDTGKYQDGFFVTMNWDESAIAECILNKLIILEHLADFEKKNEM